MGLEEPILPMHSLLRGVNQTTNIGTLPKGAIIVPPNQPDVNFLQPHTVPLPSVTKKEYRSFTSAFIFLTWEKNKVHLALPNPYKYFPPFSSEI